MILLANYQLAIQISICIRPLYWDLVAINLLDFYPLCNA